jgi:hypothetical protein
VAMTAIHVASTGQARVRRASLSNGIAITGLGPSKEASILDASEDRVERPDRWADDRFAEQAGVPVHTATPACPWQFGQRNQRRPGPSVLC